MFAIQAKGQPQEICLTGFTAEPVIRPAKWPSGEMDTAVGRLLMRRGFPGTSARSLPFGSWVVRGVSCATREHAKKSSNTKENLDKWPERLFMG